MKKKLPIIDVTGCHDCPFNYALVCFMLTPMGLGAEPWDREVDEASEAKQFHPDCPGKAYHVIVEFPE